jgi:uncharacterized protein YqhQ
MQSRSQQSATPIGHEPTPGTDRPYIGGQAVLEGVMMRSPGSLAVAVRRRDGSISIRERPVVTKPSAWSKVPVARGMVTLVSSLKMGADALRFSGDLYERDMAAADEEAKAPKKSGITSALLAFGLAIAQLTSQPDADAKKESESVETNASMAPMLIVMLAFMFFLPQMLAWGTNSALHLHLDNRSPGFQGLTGLFKLIVVVGYMMLIRRVPEIHRVFQFHGAEHKSITTYEAREALTVENARPKTTLHPRCGTTFLLMTVLVSIAVWTLLAPLLPNIKGPAIVGQLALFAFKLPFIPLLIGITFEIQRFTARYCTTGPLRALLWPGFLVQKITTIEPDDAQLEIALAALRATIWREEVGPAESLPTSDGEVLAFPSYDALTHASGLRPAA